MWENRGKEVEWIICKGIQEENGAGKERTEKGLTKWCISRNIAVKSNCKNEDIWYNRKAKLEFMEEYTYMKKYKIAAILMIIHGGFMELGGIFAMIPALLMGTDKYDIGQYFEFKLPYFQDNLYMMMVMGAIYGVFRLIGAIGLLKNRMWGLVLSVINCVITITLMMFLLPAGIMDGILAGSALVLILMQYFGDKKL